MTMHASPSGLLGDRQRVHAERSSLILRRTPQPFLAKYLAVVLAPGDRDALLALFGRAQ